MKAFPMIRTKWSNEHSMAAVFCVLALYHLPQWVAAPVGILRFLLLVVTGLFIDLIGSLIRYKKIWCCVSAAVTAAMVSLLTAGIPLWGQLLGVAVALILGKQIFGGTGKNIVNPAVVGLLTTMILFDVSYPFFSASLLLLPAMLLSIPFLRIRPFAGVAFIVGMIAALYINHNLSFLYILSSGVLFWGCLVMTDPVTVTYHPVAGAAIGFLAGFGALLFNPLPIAFVICILAVNMFSAVVTNIPEKTLKLHGAKLRIPKVVSNQESILPMIDLTEDKTIPHPKIEDVSSLSAEAILERIQKNEVFGMGGAAFPTYRKLQAVLSSKETEKYLILNGVECDPGLIHDAWLLRNHSDEIQKAVELLKSCISFTSIHLAVKDKSGLDYSSNMKVHQVPDYYPVGAERILIAEVLKKKITYDQIPAVQDILVLNVQTIYSIYQAVCQKHQVNTRYLTVADLKNKTARVIKAPIKMKIHEVMEAAYPGVLPVFAGGGMMQSYLADEEGIVGKSVNYIATGTFPVYKESPQCSHCGECSRNCPAGLKVNLIADLVDQGKETETEKYHVSECMECGSCSYSCLAGRNLAARIKMAKNSVKR